VTSCGALLTEKPYLRTDVEGECACGVLMTD
jgi:hypothetical protein